MSDKPIEDVLRRVFGYAQFRGQQAAIVDHLVKGGDALVLMPTGAGKSLCYQIPAMLRPGTAIVVSPLIALMQDQVSMLNQVGVRAAFLNSSLDAHAMRAVEAEWADGRLDLLYVAPERLLSTAMLDRLDRAPSSLFAIDEAHCVSQWGHDFRADYWRLSVLHERYPQVPRVALTATADERTRQEIIKRLNLEKAKVFCHGFDRPNIRYRIGVKQNVHGQLSRFLQDEHRGDAGIVYCLSRKRVDATTEWLSEKGFSALPYHAGLPTDLRRRNQQRFLMEEGVIMVATIAFGMGIDKPNVRFVAHLDLPKSLEAYYQETGRAGRDGLPANAWMVYGLQDVIALRQMVEASAADPLHKRVERHKLEAMLGFCELTTCRRQALLSYFGDELKQPCGNCDNCLQPALTWDATEAARKALSCVYKTGQRFGVRHLVDVLLGKLNEKVRGFAHNRLSTFGIGHSLSEKQWHSVYRQLITRGLLAVDWEGHGALRLTEACRPVLRGEQALWLRPDEASARQARPAPARFATPMAEQLWQALRVHRRRLAAQQQVPPYVIFHDAVLMDMVRLRPQHKAALGQLAGIGERKLERYGDSFLAVIQDVGGLGKSPAITGVRTQDESLKLFRLGMSVQQVAVQRGLAVTTVWIHLAQAIESGALELGAAVKLDEMQLAAIRAAWDALPEGERAVLKPLYESLGGVYSYEVLRCVRSAFRQESNESPSPTPDSVPAKGV